MFQSDFRYRRRGCDLVPFRIAKGPIHPSLQIEVNWCLNCMYYQKVDFVLGQTTVKRRELDIRFGKPDEKASRFQIVRISNVRSLFYRPDFRRSIDLEPVWNRFGTGLEQVLGCLGWNRTSDNWTSVRWMNWTSEIRTI